MHRFSFGGNDKFVDQPRTPSVQVVEVSPNCQKCKEHLPEHDMVRQEGGQK